jgi:pyrrolidone-carboxylate peptidase
MAASRIPSVKPPVGPSSPAPELVYASDLAAVYRSDDAGDFYCEHIYYLAGRAALAPGSSVRQDAAKEPLVGFLHVPGDRYDDGTTGIPSQARRHLATRSLVGAGIAGFVAAVPADVSTVRVLLTGFGRFDGVVSNPTGDFVAHPSNLDAAMAQGFGATLRTPHGTIIARSPRGFDVQYELTNGRRVVIRSVRLPVDDTAIDARSSWSIQRLYKDFRPDAALHLGVAEGREDYSVEYHADNGGLCGDLRDARHDDFAPATESDPDDFALEHVLEAASPWHHTVRDAAAAIRDVLRSWLR